MRSSTTCASSGSRRCVYCARPGSMRSRSLVSAHCSVANAPAPCDPQRSEVRDVEHDGALPARAVLLEHAAVLDRHLPTAELRHARAERAVLGVERAVTQRHLRQTRRPDAPIAAALRRRRREVERLRFRTEETVGDELRRRLEPVLHEQVQVVALVQHAHVDLGIELLHPARLAVLLGDELLVQRGDLDVEVVRRAGRSPGVNACCGLPSRSASSTNVRGSYSHSMA